MKRLLDVDGGDVVGEQDDFVGVEFVLIFAQQVGRADESALEQTHDERARAGERVYDVDILRAERRAELVLQDIFHAADDEVHDLDWRVNDAEAFGHLWESGSEKFVVKLDDNALAAFGVVYAGGLQANAVIKLGKRGGFLFQGLVLKGVEHRLHGDGDGVVPGEGVVLEQRVEDGARDEVLGKHLDGVVFGDAGVEVVAQAGEEVGEGFLVVRLAVFQ